MTTEDKLNVDVLATSSLPREQQVIEMRDWKTILAGWAVQQSFSVIVALALLYGIWHIATVIAPQHFREITESNTQAITRAISETNTAFERRTEMIVATHDRDRTSWELASGAAAKDRELMLDLLREQLRVTKQVEGKMP